MSAMVLQLPGARLGLRNGALVAMRNDRVIAQRPLHEVSEVVLIGQVALTDEARDVLVRRGVDVVYLTAAGTYRCRLIGAPTVHARRRIAQYAMSLDEGRRLAVAAAMIEGKLRNQARVATRAGRTDARVKNNVAAIRQISRRLASARTLDELRGFEGLGARLYFEALSCCIRHPELRFRGRNKRPPRDPVNACLSFGYTLLLRRVESAVMAAGLDPYVGFLHDADRGAPSLALDLMEEFRSVVVDRLVLRLINRQQLRREDFRQPNLPYGLAGAPPTDESATDTSEAVYLQDEGRSLFMREFNLVWRGTLLYAPTGNRHTVADILRMQAHALVRTIEDPARAYLPFELDPMGRPSSGRAGTDHDGADHEGE